MLPGVFRKFMELFLTLHTVTFQVSTYTLQIGLKSRTLVLRLAWYTYHFKALRHGSHSVTCKVLSDIFAAIDRQQVTPLGLLDLSAAF